MKNKRGQFYFLAIMILIVIFVSFATVFNYLRNDTPETFNSLKTELRLERQATLDYISSNDLSSSSANSLLINFSRTFTKKIGLEKNIFFIIGNPDSIKLVGNKLVGTEIQINYAGTLENITSSGEIELTYIPTINPIFIQLENNNYSFYLEQGQNIYYLISREYNEGVEIITG